MNSYHFINQREYTAHKQACAGYPLEKQNIVFYTTLLRQCCTYTVGYRPQHVMEHRCSSAQGESDIGIELEAALSWAEPCVRSFSSSLMWVFLSLPVSCCEATILLCLFHVRLLRGVEYYDCIHSQAYLQQTQRLKQYIFCCCCSFK